MRSRRFLILLAGAIAAGAVIAWLVGRYPQTLDDRGNVVVSVGYTDTEKLLQGDRPLGMFSLSSTTGAVQGSGTDVPAQLSVAATPGNTALSGRINPTTGLVGPAGSGFNFQPVNLYQAPIERYQFSAMGHYDLTDWAEFYMQALYSRTDLNTQLAQSGSFLNVYQVPIGNPFIPAGMRNQVCATRGITAENCVAGPAGTTEVPMAIGRRFTELGPRLNDFKNKWFQYTLGFRGDITDSWSYDVYYQRGEADQKQVRGNWGSLSKVQQALRAYSTSACTNTANGCVPLNIFGAEGTITQPMLNFINLNAVVGQEVTQKVGAASVSGDLGDTLNSPWSDLPIGVAVHVDQRRGWVPLRELADLVEDQSYGAIHRSQQQRAVTVFSDVDEEQGNDSEILVSVHRWFRDEVQPHFPAVRLEAVGKHQELQKGIGSLKIAFPIALLVIYMMLAGLFRSYIQPLVVMIAVPFGVQGAIIGHWLAGFEITFMSLIGLVALNGIVVNDSLVLVDFINTRVRAGATTFEACVQGSKLRLRAIILTTITTVVGMAPMIFEQSFQAKFLIPLAITLASGLTFATVLTLVVVPAGYHLVHKNGNRLADQQSNRQEVLSEGDLT